MGSIQVSIADFTGIKKLWCTVFGIMIIGDLFYLGIFEVIITFESQCPSGLMRMLEKQVNIGINAATVKREAPHFLFGHLFKKF